MNQQNKQILQEQEYDRPYHHLIHLDPPRMHEYFGDFEYFAYVREVLSSLPYSEMKDVAEVGCGDGKITLELARRYPTVNFEGYDISERAILFAKAFGYTTTNLSFFAKNFTDSDKQYDAIVCVETMEHVSDSDMPGLVESFKNKAQKYLIVSVPTINIPLSEKHYRHYTIDILKKQLNGFDLQSVKYICKENWISRLMLNILISRFFIVKTRYIINPIFKIYDKFFRFGDEKTGRHILAVFTVKKS